MKYPFVKQTGIKDCGVSCLLMIMKYYGGRASNEYLRQLTNTTKDGVDSYSLLKGAKKLGFSTKGVNGNIEDLENKDLPCIAHVIINKSYKHFIVIYKNDKKKHLLTIGDPGKNKISKIDYESFKKISTNNYLLLYPEKTIPIIKNEEIIKTIIKKYIKENKLLFLLLIIFSLIITFLGIIISYEFQILMDLVIGHANNLNKFLLMFLIIILLNILIKLIRQTLLNYINHSLNKEMIINVYDRLLSLPYLYYKNRTTGEVISRIQDLDNIKDFVCKIFITCFIDLSLAIITLIILWNINSNITKILLISTGLIIFILIISWKILHNKIKELKDNNANVNHNLIESISGIETIRGFGLEKYIKNKFILSYDKYQKNSYDTNKIFIYFEMLKNLIEEITILIVLVYGTYLINNNIFTIGHLITYYLLLSYFLDPIKNIFSLGISYKDTKISLERINDLYNYQLDKKGKLIINSKISGNIEVKNLNYNYSPKKKLLNNLNIKINDKDKILLYGKSGSGKSTLAKILAKIIPYTDGNIKLNNIPLNEYNNDYLLKRVCYMSQNEMLFQDSIYENINLNNNIEYKKFLEVCSICLVDEIVENNQLKYDMLIEENGFNISGGEKQRILLARAILKDADIYILDESLNEIDVERERKILNNLFQKYKNKTFIVISHRYHNNDLFNRKIEIINGECYEKY